MNSPPAVKSPQALAWEKLRDEVGKIYVDHRRMRESGSGHRPGEPNDDLLEAFLAVHNESFCDEFQLPYWNGHDSACAAMITIIRGALDHGIGGNFGSPELTKLVDDIIALRKKTS